VTVPVKVLVVDDHPLARRGVASLLAEAFPSLELREAGTTSEAITTAAGFQPMCRSSHTHVADGHEAVNSGANPASLNDGSLCPVSRQATMLA